MIGVTGANGYVGARVLAHLRANGQRAVALVRDPAAATGEARRYALGDTLTSQTLADLEVVVHAAYDLSARGGRVRELNYDGSLPLLDAIAERAGKVILISSLAAFEGARSEYGLVKLALERAVRDRGGVALRAGVVFGVRAGGLFGTLAESVRAHTFVPLIGGGWQRLFVTHDESLCSLVAALAQGHADADGALFAAHETPTTLRALAAQIAAAQGHRFVALPIPARPAYLALRVAERLGAQLAFRSDSLRSLEHPIPLDQVAALARGPVSFPPLSSELWRG